MKRFHFLTLQPPDLLALNIKGSRLRLVAIADTFENDIFQEFTREITRYMVQVAKSLNHWVVR
jgi:hypothetical protein